MLGRRWRRISSLVGLFWFMLFNATFNNISAISWRSVLLILVEETGENHRPVASHWQTLSHNHVVSITPRHARGSNSGVDPGGGAAPGARPPPPKIGKNMIFWRKIVIFHTKYPKNFRASLRNWKKIWFFGVKSWFFTRNNPKNFVPPSARRNFF